VSSSSSDEENKMSERDKFAQLVFYKEMVIMSEIAYRIHGDEAALSILKQSQYFYEKELQRLQPKNELMVIKNQAGFEAALQHILA
jgi:hypothetical protein